MVRYVIYGKDGCPYCTDAKILLESLKIHYTYNRLNEDYTFKDFLNLSKEHTKGAWKTFPMIFKVNCESSKLSFIGGYTDLNYLLRDKTNDISNKKHTEN